MFNQFPREIALPKRYIIHSWKEMEEIINKNNGKVSIYTTIYSFENIVSKHKYGRTFDLAEYRTAIIDKLFFDLDKEDCWQKTLKFHNYLKKQDIMHCINFSGKGFHIYIFTKEVKNDLKYKKDAYFNIQKFFADHNGLTIGESEKADLDTAVIGDLARITRIPNTFNMRRKRYCIPITEDDLLLGYENIKEKAKEQQYPKHRIFGRKKVDLKYFDSPKFGSDSDDAPKVKIPPIKVDVDFGEEKLYPCVKKMLVQRSGFRAWFNSALWLREKGYTEQEADEIFKKYLGKWKRSDGWTTDYHHSREHDKTILTVFSDKQQNYKFPRCESMFVDGFCKGKCKHYNDLYWNRVKKNDKKENK